MGGKPFKIATFNANSIRTRLDQIIAWLDQQQPDVLCIQETKVQDADFPEGAIRDAGYHVSFCGQKAYAGVAIISRDEPADVDCGLTDDGEPDRPRLIRARFGEVHVVNTYVPQGRDIESEHFAYKLEWLARVRAFFESHYSPHDLVCWVGDLNVAPEEIDVHDPKRLAKHVDFHPKAREALAQVREWGFVDVFRRHHPGEEGQFTYWDYRVRGSLDRNIGWRIDHIYATAPLADKSSGCWIDIEARRAERPSDHTLLVAEFDLG